jgi:hypothetical protein
MTSCLQVLLGNAAKRSLLLCSNQRASAQLGWLRLTLADFVTVGNAAKSPWWRGVGVLCSVNTSRYINNIHLFTRNMAVHNIGTRQNVNLSQQSTSLTIVQKGAYYLGIKIYNHLPKELKQLSNNQKSFERSLKRFLLANSFYALNGYFNYNCTQVSMF